MLSVRHSLIDHLHQSVYRIRFIVRSTTLYNMPKIALRLISAISQVFENHRNSKSSVRVHRKFIVHQYENNRLKRDNSKKYIM